MTRRVVPRRQDGGFTLIEVVVALAITGLFIGVFGEVIDLVARSWNRGNALVSLSEMTLRGVRQIARDLEGARLLLTGGASEPRVLFDGESNVVRFITAAENRTNAKAGAVEVAILVDGDRTLIRRRSVGWGPSDYDFASLAWSDPVILMQGRYDARFSFASGGGDRMIWRNSWSQESKLPRLVRLTLTNRDTGQQAIAPIMIPILADADAACVTEPRGADCPAEVGRPQASVTSPPTTGSLNERP